MFRISITVLLINVWFSAWSQIDSTIVRNQELAAVKVDRFYNMSYKQTLNKLKRVYPMALEAKRVLVELDAELAEMSRNGKKKKYTKEVHEQLKDDFTYAIKDLYRSEGILLMKLIHRETGMTVDEITRKYKGKLNASFSTNTLKLFDLNAKVKYDPKGTDRMTEQVIQDINNGLIPFDKSLPQVDKIKYKEGMKEYHSKRKSSKKKRKTTSKK